MNNGVIAESINQFEKMARLKGMRGGFFAGNFLKNINRQIDFKTLVVKYFETNGPVRIKFRIAPITKLKVVMVQKGYIRIDPVEGIEVPVYYEETTVSGKIEKWFIGVELKGEGIFIDIESPQFVPRGNAAREWHELYRLCYNGECEYKSHLFRDPNDRIELHPLFVWWHSLAHKLISWLAIDSGYSLASLRERVYCDGKSGGVLIYTSQPGGDGSLGGLFGLIDRFREILKDAYLSANFCWLNCGSKKRVWKRFKMARSFYDNRFTWRSC